MRINLIFTSVFQYIQKQSTILCIFTVLRITNGGPEQTVSSKSAVTQESHGSDKNHTANCAGFSLEEETDEVKRHEHDVCLEQRRIYWFGNQQHGYQPLQAVHSVCTSN